MIKFYKRVLYISILLLGIFSLNKTYALGNQPKAVNKSKYWSLFSSNTNLIDSKRPAIINSLVLRDVPPVANPNTKSVNEDVTLNVLNNSTDDLLSNDFDPDGSPISITKYTIGGVDYAVGTAHLIPLQGTITIRANGSYTFIPVANYNGAVDQITYTITDGLLFASSTLDITVISVNDDPIALPDVGTGLEGQTLNVSSINGILSNDSDVDGNILYVVKFRVFGIPGNQIIGDDFLIPGVGTINISITGRYSFRPVADFTGAVPTITYTILDGPGGEASSTLNITVLAVNDVPSFIKGLDQVTYIDFPTQTVTNWATALSKGPANESSQVLDFIVTNDKNTLFSTQPSISASGTLTYKPAPGQYGRATVTVQIHDNGGTANGGIDTSAPQTFLISVKPIGINDNDLTPINTPTTTIVTANDGASGIGTTVIAGSTGPANGVIVVNADNTITYTPNANYIGPDTYTYILRTPDGVDSDPVTVNINVYKAEFTLAKDGVYNDFNADGKVNVGDRINYTFAIKNTGTIAVTGINIVDAKLTAITGGPISSLAVGITNSNSITGYYVITQADIDNSGVYNTATATGKDPKNNDVIITSTDPTPLDPQDVNYPVAAPTPACPTCTITPLVQSGGMKVEKEGVYFDFNTDGKVNVGDRINYTFIVTNTGNVTLSNVNITDPNAVITGNQITSFAVGAVDNNSFTGYHVITQADIDNSGVYNLATATSKDPKNRDIIQTSEDPTPLNLLDPNYPIAAPTPACPTCTITPLVQKGALTLLKDGVYFDFNADGKVNVGDRINYTFIVSNTGNVTLNNVNITDPNAVINGTSISTFAVGAVDNATFTGYHVLTQADIDNSGVYNLATATALDPKSKIITITSNDPTPLAIADPNYPITAPTPACPTCTITPVVQSGALALLKDGVYNDFNADGKVNVGDRINYTFSVTNTGNVTLRNVTITDPNAVIVGSPILSFAVGATDNSTFSGYYVLTQSDIDNSGVYNLATVAAKDPRDKDITATSTDPTPLNVSDPNYPLTAPTPACVTCTITPLVQSPSLLLFKDGTYADTNGDGKVNTGDRINYTFNIVNTGNVTLTNIVVTDNNAVVNGATLTSLAPGANNNSLFTAYHILTQADIDNAGVFNLATATGKSPKATNVTITSIDPTPLLVGDATYPILPPTPACTTCTVTPIVQATGLTLLKDGVYADTNADGKVNVGDRINYTFTVANTGNVTLTNVTVTDPNAVMVGSPIVSFAVGAVNNTTFTGYHILTQADIDNAGVFNLATATAKSPRNTNVTVTSTDPTPLIATSPLYPINAPVPACPTCTVTPVAQTASLTLLKDGVYNDFNADGKVNVGDRIVYSFTVINSGNTTLTNVNVTDPNAIMSGSALATLAPGVSNNSTFTGYHTITQAEIDNRGVFNLATATAKDTKNNTISIVSNDPTPLVSTSPQYPLVAPVPSCSACTVTPIAQNGAIALVKTVTNTGTGAGGVFILGNVIQYTFNITNTGNVTLNNLTLTDAKLATGAINVGVNLAPGASTTLIRIYVITAADVTAGSVTNSATVTATTPAGTVVTDLSGSLVTNDVPTVTPVSKPLVAVNDLISTRQGELVNIAIQANDIQGSTAIVPTSVVITVAPLHGTAVINNNGSVNYTPVLGYIGTDVFSYTIKDLSGQTSNVATVTINVLLSAPKAIDDKITTTYNKLVTIPIILNDVKDGVDFDLTSIQIVSQPTRGTVKINADGSVTYTPNKNETGIDTFTYRIKDLNGNFTNTATVTISIEGLLFGNVITPNGDGKNDFWVIVGANTYDKVEVEIYNRYGNQVYMSKAYKNDWNGANLNEGTYYYTAILYRGGVATTVKGWVLIKR